MIQQMLSDNIMVRILEQPIGWRTWILWLMTVNTAAFAFLARSEGKVIAAVWIANALTMSVMYWIFGYVRLLGLSHILWWTPLFLWLIPRLRGNWPGGAFGLWLKLLIISDLASLAIDYVDVARYILGDRAAA